MPHPLSQPRPIVPLSLRPAPSTNRSPACGLGGRSPSRRYAGEVTAAYRFACGRSSVSGITSTSTFRVWPPEARMMPSMGATSE